MIETMRAASLNDKPVPNDDETEMQFATAAGTAIDWNKFGLVTNKPATFAKIVQDVLTQNGISSTANYDYPSARALADDLVTSGMPAIANVIVAQQGKFSYEHAVLMQWDTDQQKFLVDNIDTLGTTRSYTRSQFESGELWYPFGGPGGLPRLGYVKLELHNAVVFAKRR